MFGLGFSEILILCVLGVVFFGKGLPGMARSMGKALQELRNGLRGVEDDYDTAPVGPPRPGTLTEPPRPPQRMAPSAPKFDDGGV
jgi:sec-independent protein translocase protein TatA